MVGKNHKVAVLGGFGIGGTGSLGNNPHFTEDFAFPETGKNDLFIILDFIDIPCAFFDHVGDRALLSFLEDFLPLVKGLDVRTAGPH
ncbi:hypothetical protein ADUPG1_004845 [Aduncisulcus paluster]|uniref:Uncharacterized protein n=1 Tax=Aduncisulcus paluster TaxID=2918883 RepID=A0ABQ5KB25_9EUKA|nr:hypothetical protein ADUPG1_004845 [Aduncisulcus paluster]